MHVQGDCFERVQIKALKPGLISSDVQSLRHRNIKHALFGAKVSVWRCFYMPSNVGANNPVEVSR